MDTDNNMVKAREKGKAWGEEENGNICKSVNNKKLNLKKRKSKTSTTNHFNRKGPIR